MNARTLSSVLLHIHIMYVRAPQYGSTLTLVRLFRMHKWVSRCVIRNVLQQPPNPHNPPEIENEDRINTSTLITAQMNGIHVVIRRKPALYTAPSLPATVVSQTSGQ